MQLEIKLQHGGTKKNEETQRKVLLFKAEYKTIAISSKLNR